MANLRERQLSGISSVWNAFLSIDISHYPRFRINGKEKKLESDVVILRIAKELNSLSDDQRELEHNLKLARESLDEVKSLTEYEDQKATRILTIATIFIALAGLIFTRIADLYPLRAIITKYGAISGFGLLVSADYLFFFCFILFTVCGALVIFHATRIRFVYPSPDLNAAVSCPALAKSFLFYKEIIQVEPENWARSFLHKDQENSKIRGNLSLEYFKNYIIESYLVASKVADKLRYLMPAQNILALSIRILLIWMLLDAVIFVLIPEVPRPAVSPDHSLAVNSKVPIPD